MRRYNILLAGVLKLVLTLACLQALLLSAAFAQAVLNPNEVKGRIEFTNTNPDILAILAGDRGLSSSWITANSVGINPPLSSWLWVYNADDTGVNYNLTLESAASGIPYDLRPDLRVGYATLYVFATKSSGAMYPEPAPDAEVNFRECASVLDIRWVDSQRNPARVEGGYISLFPETTPGNFDNQPQAQNYNIEAGRTQEYMFFRGTGKKARLYSYYMVGAEDSRVSQTCEMQVTATCDAIQTVYCEVPPPPPVGQIRVNIDMLGQIEHLNDNTYYPYTHVTAYGGPLGTWRRVQLKREPSSGEVILPNLPPTKGANGYEYSYSLFGEMAFGLGRREQYFRTPDFSQNTSVVANQTKDLGNLYVFNPGKFKGNVRFAVPPSAQAESCMNFINRDSDWDSNHDGKPDYQWAANTYVGAYGDYRKAAGATYSSSGGIARAEFDGSFDAANGEYTGDYELLVGGMNGERSFWQPNNIALSFYTTAWADWSRAYRYQWLNMVNNGIESREIGAGETQNVDQTYCFSEVELTYRSLGGNFTGPRATINGSFTGLDFQDQNADYRVSYGSAYGSPLTSEGATEGVVRMCLPQGSYTFNPTVRMVSGSGSYGETALRPVTLEVGCRQVIKVSNTLQLNLGRLPQETDVETLTFFGAANADNDIQSITYAVNGGAAQQICTNCGKTPRFSDNLGLVIGQNEIVVTATDVYGQKASVTGIVKRKPYVPDLTLCKNGKVLICHIPPGNESNAHSLRVSINAWPAHLAHGDTLGACDGESGPIEEEGGSGTCPDQVRLCHIPPGNESNKHTLDVGWSAVSAHLAHGDTLGDCPAAPPGNGNGHGNGNGNGGGNGNGNGNGNGGGNSLNPAEDSDGDGITNGQESSDGTDPLDAGSFRDRLRSPIYTLWNRALDMTNIVELVNPSDSESSTVKLSLFGMNGDIAHEMSFVLAPQQQRDVILNDLPGFRENPYGLVKIEFAPSIEGRVMFYRGSGSGSYDYVFNVPLSNATFGKSAVGFNTFDPSNGGKPVYNWLSLVNLAPEMKRFLVKTYGRDGSLLAQRQVFVAAYGRADIDGGHGLVGANSVGMHEIVPADMSAPYVGQLMRYGSKYPAGSPNTGFDFAFALGVKHGNGRPLTAPISRTNGEDNWVEVTNTSDGAVNATVRLRDQLGNELSSSIISLAPYAQEHISAAALPLGQLGQVEISSDHRESLIAQSMFYYRASDGSIASMCGTQASEAMASNLTGSFNRFLGMENWLRIVNPESSAQVATVEVSSAAGYATQSYSIPAGGAVKVALHDSATFNTSADSYGVVKVGGGGKLIGEVVRIRKVGSAIDFVTVTPVR